MGGRSSSFGKKAGGGAKLDLPELEEHPHYDKWDASLYFFKFNYGK